MLKTHFSKQERKVFHRVYRAVNKVAQYVRQRSNKPDTAAIKSAFKHVKAFRKLPADLREAIRSNVLEKWTSYSQDAKKE